ncbi:MAG TPA: tetratricopeptide repeat protein [Pyrinomonadaceae bacterium]|jgi:tetratricopeptide (TPR) repeat protein
MSNELPLTEALELFYSYSHEDEDLRDGLQTHLSTLKRQNVINGWHDRRVVAGEEWGGEIDEHLKTADIILLLVSSDFLASDYCYATELTLAMRRHDDGEACVVPVILRPCDWKGVPFGKLQALPKNARPVTTWPNRDEAFTDVAIGIRKAAADLLARRQAALAAGAAGEAQAASAPKSVTSFIPRPPVVGFVARRDEQGHDTLELLAEELAPEKNQLVALWGPGGSGKTTLAAEFVRSVAGVFGGRVAWVSALGRVDFSLATLLDEIAIRLGREELRKPAPEQKAAKVATLVSSEPTLVVLDNFETISEEVQRLCLDFLARAAACPALITTRWHINRDDVYNVPLAAMTMEEAREFLGRVVEHTRKPSAFDKLDHDDLIRRCEANPLVIQWVIRQIDLAKRPQDVLNDLGRGEGDAAERVFARSFNLPQLGDDCRDVLLALSLFTPDASRESLADVTGFGDSSRRLEKAVEGLSALWLVETTEGNERLFIRGLTRELTKSLLSKDGRAGDFRRRYIDHFQRHAEAHEQPTPEDLNALEPEKDNLLGAMDSAFGARDWESVMWIRSALDHFLDLRGYWDEAIRSGELAEAAARAAKNDPEVGHFKAMVARIRSSRGEYEEARRIYQEAEGIFKRWGDKKSVAECLHQLGLIAQLQGDLKEAHRLYSASLEIMKRLGNQTAVAYTIHQLGRVAQIKGDFEEARGLYAESLEISRGLDLQEGIAGTLNQLATLAVREGDIEEARRLYEASLEIKRKLGNQHGAALSLGNLGLLAEKEGRKAEAAQLFREALSIFEKLRSQWAEDARRGLKRVSDTDDGAS